MSVKLKVSFTCSFEDFVTKRIKALPWFKRKFRWQKADYHNCIIGGITKSRRLAPEEAVIEIEDLSQLLQMASIGDLILRQEESGHYCVEMYNDYRE